MMSTDNPFAVPESDKGPQGNNAGSAEVSELAVKTLKETRPWVLLMGVLFSITTIMFIFVCFALVASDLHHGNVRILGGIYAVFTFMFGCLGWSLMQYASKIKALGASYAMCDLEGALAAQRVYWRTIGIFFFCWIILSMIAVSNNIELDPTIRP